MVMQSDSYNLKCKSILKLRPILTTRFRNASFLIKNQPFFTFSSFIPVEYVLILTNHELDLNGTFADQAWKLDLMTFEVS